MKQAWSDVGEGFSALGRMMKERYQAGGADEGDEAADDSGTREAGAALRDAMDKVVSAARELGDRAADVARDDDVKAQAKRATGSLSDALSATVNLIGDEVGGLFGRAKRDNPEVPPGEAPPSGSDDVRQ